MKRTQDLIVGLSWNKDKFTQNSSISVLGDIDDDEIDLLIQPLKSTQDLIAGLSWNNDKSTQNSSISALMDIDDDEIDLLIQPFNDKAYWENAAIVLKKIGYPRIKSVIPKLLEWLCDLNWPGAITIFELLCTIDTDVLLPYLKDSLLSAKEKNDIMWITAINQLLDCKGIATSSFDNNLREILKLAEF